MIILYLGSLSGYQLKAIALFYFLLTLFCLYLVIKQESKLSFVLWCLVILFFPIVGSLIYLSRWFLLKGKAQ